jgi:2-keto-4-pentenoate hydratase
VTQTPDIERATKLLADAWRRGVQFDALPIEARPTSMDQGYDMQDRLLDVLGEAVVGWKLGVGSVKGRRESGIGRAIAGRVVRSRLFNAGDTIALHDDAPVTFEFEIAFVIGRTIRPGDAIADLPALIADTRLTCELVRSRFVDRRAVGWPSFTADNSGFDALVVGPSLASGAITVDAIDAFMRTLVVFVDGVERVRAAQGDDVTEPFGALQDFLALANERRMTVPAGSIISTGTQSVPLPIRGPATIEGRSALASLAFTTAL